MANNNSFAQSISELQNEDDCQTPGGILVCQSYGTSHFFQMMLICRLIQIL